MIELSYFPINTPSYNQYDDEDSLLVQAAKRAAQERQMQAQGQYAMPQFDVGGYQPQSNQQETLQRLNAYSQWANNAPQPQQQGNGTWDGVNKIIGALGQKYGGNSNEAMMQNLAQEDARNQAMAGMSSARAGNTSPLIGMLMQFINGVGVR